MKISSDDLIGLPVYTQSETHLGKIDSLDIDIDLNSVTNYYVKTGLIKGLWHERLIIAPSQVVSITKDKMIIEDGASGEKEKVPDVGPMPALSPEVK